ncbi:MAG: general secretion pathway protein GspK, partial [Planctomycetes bacterium]|nr:general secretion pathway protein GspK [Planctomycetota bacterium]
MAVDAILDELTEVLVKDVPGVSGQEYYDAPDANDTWLSSAEPMFDGNAYYWPQVTSLQGHNTWFEISFVDDRAMLLDVDPNTGVLSLDQKADADGDGLADTHWFKLDGFTSSSRKPVYAALRVVDHGRMFNVNTAYQDTNDVNMVDQPSPLQIDIVGLFDTPAGQLQLARTQALSLQAYLEDVVWHFDPFAAYHHPFDIQDELELRSRYLINNEAVYARIETKDANGLGWGEMYDTGFVRPQTTDLANWFRHAYYDTNEAASYDHRHITTTVSLDRVITPDGLKMLNVNQGSSLADLYEAVKQGLSPETDSRRMAWAAQIAINLWDFQDTDTEPGVIYLSDVERAAITDDTPNAYYGFESHPYISEVAFQVDQDDPEIVTVDIEFYNPSQMTLDLDALSLLVTDSASQEVVGTIDLPAGTTLDSHGVFGMTLAASDPLPVAIQDGFVTAYHDVFLTRQVHDVNLCLDVFRGQSWSDTNDGFGNPDEPTPGVWHCMARDTQGWQVAYQIYEYSTDHTQGRINDGVTVLNRSAFTVLDPHTQMDAALGHPKLDYIGQLGRLLSVGPGPEPNAPFSTIGERLTDPNQGVEDVFVDLALTRYSKLFQRLTVLDPVNYGVDDDSRVKGRININTAPWTVLQGLPGLDLASDANLTPERSIALYREIDPNHVYQSVGDLMQVPEIVTMGQSNADAVNLKQRDQMFTRLADLATVRSDVFTAYILVRLGVDGPQKRLLAVLDRSQVDDAQDRIRILALQPVPESR